MKRNATQKNFRLSAQAVQALSEVRKLTGSSETAIVEQAIFHYCETIGTTTFWQGKKTLTEAKPK